MAISLRKKKVAGDGVPTEQGLITSARNDKTVFDDKASHIVGVTFQDAICRATNGAVGVAGMGPRKDLIKIIFENAIKDAFQIRPVIDKFQNYKSLKSTVGIV